MAKTVKEERLSIILTLTRSGGTGSVQIEARTDYEVSSDDLMETRSLAEGEGDLTAEERQAIKSFAQSRLAKIKQIEEG